MADESPQRAKKNPFYILSVILGIAFVLTACAYGVMTLREANPEMAAESSSSGGRMMEFLSDYGALLFLIELALLGLTTVIAIATDNYWTGGEQHGPTDETPASASGGESLENEAASS